MPMKMEITSIKDVGNDFAQGEESIEVEKVEVCGSNGKEVVEGELYDAFNEFPYEEEGTLTKPSRKHEEKKKMEIDLALGESRNQEKLEKLQRQVHEKKNLS